MQFLNEATIFNVDSLLQYFFFSQPAVWDPARALRYLAPRRTGMNR